MTEIIIVASRSFDRRGKRRHDRFDARLKGGAEAICVATRQPLLDASRVLLSRGFDPSTVLCMVHSLAPAVVTMRAAIGVAGLYDVMGSAFVRRNPATRPMPGSDIESDGSAEPRTPRKTEADAGAPHIGSTLAATRRSQTSSPPPPSTSLPDSRYSQEEK